jgi:hypothetical protein
MIDRALTALERLTLVPLLVRAGAFAAGLAALLLAAPAPLRALPPIVAGLVLLAALPALAPAGPWSTVVMLATGAGWLLSTESYDRPVTVPRVLFLAALLYLLHSLSALAAAVPSDAVVAPDVPARWLLRTLAVLAVGSALSGAVLAGLDAVAGDRVYVAATLAGLVAAVALAASLRRS